MEYSYSPYSDQESLLIPNSYPPTGLMVVLLLMELHNYIGSYVVIKSDHK